MKTTQHSTLLAVLILLWKLTLPALAQEANPSIKTLNEVFLKGSTDFAKNKVFIKTDKDIYCPGEKIWFKAEIFNCLTEELANETQLIVMLKGENGEVITDNKYLATGGTCDNEMIIPSWAPEGDAYLVAYTPKAIQTNDASLAAVKPITINTFRKNDYIIDLRLNKTVFNPGDDAKLGIELTSLTPGLKREKVMVTLYDQNQKIYAEKVSVTVNELNEVKVKLPGKISNGLYFKVNLFGKNYLTQKIPVHTVSDNISIEFYPEGGTLLANNIQRILYRATDPFGNPIDVSGSVYDQQGNQAGAGKIIKKGYGLINIMPMPNQKYDFKIEDEYGKNLEFELPEAQTDGSVFSLIKTEDSTLRAAVFTIGKYASEIMTLAAVANGKVVLTSAIDGSIKNNLKIATSSLPPGIVNFVIFADDGKILSERLVFNTPNREIDIDIDTRFKPTEKNGEAEITIDMSKFIERFGPSKVDIRVIDKFNLFDPNQLVSKSFLKYPLHTAIPKTVLDIYLTNLELIANEIKNYSLNDLIAGKDYFKHDAGKNIGGTVIDKNRKGVANATVMAIQSNNLFQATTTTDNKGRFVFDKITKSNDIFVKAFSSSGKKSYTVHLDQTFDESLEEIILHESFRLRPAYTTSELIDYCRRNRELLRSIGTEHRDPKPEKESGTEKLLQSGSSIMEVIKMTKPFKLEGNQIVFFGSSNSLNYQSGALIVIDGQKMGTDVSALNSVSPFDVKSINISTNPVDIQRYTGLNSVGIIEITTRGEPADFLPNQKDAGFHGVAKFDSGKIPHNIWRYQTTLLWKNDIPVDESGNLQMKILVSEIQSEFVVQVDVESTGRVKHHESTTFSTIRLQPSE
jgi:hypothetical protein